jgi:predicted HicB family RNase H-like nuclease
MYSFLHVLTPSPRLYSMGEAGDLSQVAARKRKASQEAKQEAKRAAQEPTKRLNANVPESLHRAVRVEAARRGIDMKQVMVEALEEYLPNYPDE